MPVARSDYIIVHVLDLDSCGSTGRERRSFGLMVDRLLGTTAVPWGILTPSLCPTLTRVFAGGGTLFTLGGALFTAGGLLSRGIALCGFTAADIREKIDSLRGLGADDVFDTAASSLVARLSSDVRVDFLRCFGFNTMALSILSSVSLSSERSLR